LPRSLAGAETGNAQTFVDGVSESHPSSPARRATLSQPRISELRPASATPHYAVDAYQQLRNKSSLVASMSFDLS
jgi:hypothetical protein